MGLLFFLLFFIFAALGVELFGRLECSEENPCQGLGEHAHFANFGMAFLTLFRVATGDNWNGIMKDTLRDDCDDAADCVRNCCVSTVIAPIFFVIFVLMAQFVLVNVVVAVLMKHLEESHKQMEDEMDMDTELEREFQQEQEFEEEQAMCMQLQEEENLFQKRPLAKILSLPSNFTYTATATAVFNQQQRRQTLHYLNQSLRPNGGQCYDEKNSICEVGETTVDAAANRRTSKGSAASMQSMGSGAVDRRMLRGKGWNKRFKKEMSLDEDCGRKRDKNLLEVKRMSCDNLPWKLEKNCGPSKLTFESASAAVPAAAAPDSGRDKDVTTICDGDGVVDVGNISPAADAGKVATTFQRVGPPASRIPSIGGGQQKLLKQRALDAEDAEVDENTLLLPGGLSKQQSFGDDDCFWEDGDLTTPTEVPDIGPLIGGATVLNAGLVVTENILKSDSTELLRIISERRMFEKRDENESGVAAAVVKRD